MELLLCFELLDTRLQRLHPSLAVNQVVVGTLVDGTSWQSFSGLNSPQQNSDTEKRQNKWWKHLKILKLRIILKKNSDQPFPIQKLPSLWNIFQSLAAPARHRRLPSPETRETRKLQGTLEDFISEPWTKIRALTMNALLLQPFQKWKWDQWLVTHRSPFPFLAHFFLLWRSGLKFLRKAILPTLLTGLSQQSCWNSLSLQAAMKMLDSRKIASTAEAKCDGYVLSHSLGTLSCQLHQAKLHEC